MTSYERQDPVAELLARIIRSKIADGTLPRGMPTTTRIGIGSGNPCTACENPILPAQTEFEPHYEDRGLIRFHGGCHGLWEAERHRRDQLPK